MQLKRNNTPYDLATVKNKLSKKLDTFADGEILVINLNDGKSIIGCKNNNQIDLFDITETPTALKYNPNSTAEVKVDLQNNWVDSTKTINGYQMYMSSSNYNIHSSYANMKLYFTGIPDFTFYINSYGEANYDYTVVFKMDYNDIPSSYGYGTDNVIAHTYGKSYNPTSKEPSKATNEWTRVNIKNDGGEHFVVIGYRKDVSGNSNDDRGYIAIPLSIDYEITKIN